MKIIKIVHNIKNELYTNVYLSIGRHEVLVLNKTRLILILRDFNLKRSDTVFNIFYTGRLLI